MKQAEAQRIAFEEQNAQDSTFMGLVGTSGSITVDSPEMSNSKIPESNIYFLTNTNNYCYCEDSIKSLFWQSPRYI